MRRFSAIRQHQGLTGLVKHLKVVTVVVQQILGGHIEKDLTSLGPRISRSKGGFPRILPVEMRNGIRNGEIPMIKLILSLTNIYRVILYETPLKIQTIISPRRGSFQGEKRIVKFIPKFWASLAPTSTIGLQSLSSPDPFPMTTASPNSTTVNPHTELEIFESSTHENSIFRSRIALWRNSEIERSLLKFMSFLPQSYSYNKIWMLTSQAIEGQLGRVLVNFVNNIKSWETFPKRTDYLGRLGTKIEPAGKVRVFAMVDCFTQWALRPLHRQIFSILRKIPMDGTFNQMKPLSRVPFGSTSIYSFDLSAATDRLPVSLQEKLLAEVYTAEFACVWRQLLVNRTYFLPKSEISEVKYAVGQPMGALSSWSMLALTHHFIVQCAAWIAGHPQHCLFDKYAVLGDDIVIWDTPTAKQYLKIMDSLGVDIGLAKSIVSLQGDALEFAKRTIYKGQDVSPVPLKEYSVALQNGSSFMSFIEKYQLSDLSIQRLLGMGYKSTLHNIRWRMFSVLRDFPLAKDNLTVFLRLEDTISTQTKYNLTLSLIKSMIKSMERRVKVT